MDNHYSLDYVNNFGCYTVHRRRCLWSANYYEVAVKHCVRILPIVLLVMIVNRVVALARTRHFCTSNTLTRRFSSHTAHAREDVLPETGFFTPFWRNTILLSFAAIAFYKWAPRPGEEAFLTQWLAHQSTAAEFWARVNEQQLLRSQHMTVNTVLQTSAQRPGMVRYRYPQMLEQGSPHLQPVGVASSVAREAE
ncbi:hypothetical protein BKA83DRAFT_3066948 [Pisolithus microcarpus]|nr:hypothetical protein BKA83DRAFT_3066948 [Pisolithus microcarpus]